MKKSFQFQVFSFKPLTWLPLVLFLLWLATLACHGQATVIFGGTNIVGTTANRVIHIQPHTPGQFLGSNFIEGKIDLQPTNGVRSITLIQSDYDVTVDGINKVFRMPVPAGTGTYYAYDLIVQGVAAHTPLATLIASNNVSIVTNFDQLANIVSYFISATGGGGTNIAPITNAIASTGIAIYTNGASITVSNLVNTNSVAAATATNAGTAMNATNVTGPFYGGGVLGTQSGGLNLSNQFTAGTGIPTVNPQGLVTSTTTNANLGGGGFTNNGSSVSVNLTEQGAGGHTSTLQVTPAGLNFENWQFANGGGNFSGTLAGGVFNGTSVGPGTNTLATNAFFAGYATNAGTATNAANFTGNLAGNVTGPMSATVVSSVGGAALPAAQITGVVSKTNGGNGFAQTNWVPAGASYDDASTWGYPQFTVPVLSNGVYAIYIPGNGASNDQGAIFYGDLSGSIGTSGLFIPLTNHLQVFANTPSTPVLSKIFLIGYTNGFDTNALYADVIGRFTGVVDPTSEIYKPSLPSDVVYNDEPFAFFTTNSANKIYNTNDVNSPGNGGSTLSLVHYGTNGYTDINFYTAPNRTQAVLSPTLEFALGVGFAGNANVAYRNPYIEMYHNDKSFYFVESTLIHGGAQRLATGLAPTWAWFLHGDTNQPLWRADPASGIVTNYGQFVAQSNVTFNANLTLSLFPTNGNILFTTGTGQVYSSNAVPSAMLTSVPAGNLTGTIADGRLSANVPLLNAANNFTGSNNFAGGAALTNNNNAVSAKAMTNTSLTASKLMGTDANKGFQSFDLIAGAGLLGTTNATSIVITTNGGAGGGIANIFAGTSMTGTTNGANVTMNAVASSTFYKSTALVEDINSSAANTMISFTIPANTLVSNVLIEAHGDCFAFSSSQTGQPAFYYGGNTLWGGVSGNVSIAAGTAPNRREWWLRCLLTSSNAANNQQVFTAFFEMGAAAAPGTNGWGTLNGSQAISAVIGGTNSTDSTADQIFKMDWLWSAANTNASIRVRGVTATAF